MKNLTEFWQMNSYTNEEIISLDISLSGDALVEFMNRAIPDEQADLETENEELLQRISDLEELLEENDIDFE